MIPLIAGAPPARTSPIDLIDLVKGPSSTFKGGIGSWVGAGTGTTLTHETGAGYSAAPGRGALKFHTTVANMTATATLAIPGTFKSGHRYQVELLLKHSILSGGGEEATYQPYFGLIGTETAAAESFKFTNTGGSFGDLRHDRTYRVVVQWIPAADRTGVVLNLTRVTDGIGLTVDLYVLAARVALVPMGSPGFLYAARLDHPDGLPEYPAAGNGGGLLNGFAYATLFGVPKMRLSKSTLHFQGPRGTDGNNSNFSLGSWGTYIDAVQQSGPGRRTGEGIDVEVGPDYLGFYIAERDPTTVEIWNSYGNDTILLDGGDDAEIAAAHWWHEEADGAYKGGAGRKSRIGSYFQETLRIPGALTVAGGINEPLQHLQLPYPVEIDEVRVHVGTAPTGATLIVDVHVNGTTIFTVQANRPTIAIAASDATSGAPDTTTVDKDDVLTVDVDQVGSTIAGSDLTVMIRGRYLW